MPMRAPCQELMVIGASRQDWAPCRPQGHINHWTMGSQVHHLGACILPARNTVQGRHATIARRSRHVRRGGPLPSPSTWGYESEPVAINPMAFDLRCHLAAVGRSGGGGRFRALVDLGHPSPLGATQANPFHMWSYISLLSYRQHIKGIGKFSVDCELNEF
jgi:hypothetical protein